MYSDYFELSSKSPSGLIWRVNKGRANAGEPAITAIGNGYYKGRLNQKKPFTLTGSYLLCIIGMSLML